MPEIATIGDSYATLCVQPTRFEEHFLRFRFSLDASHAYPELRASVRAFLQEEQSAGRFSPRPNCWMHYDAGFSRRCGERGFVGITFPREYGGRGGSAFERYIVCEEMLAAGAPVGMHWIADRQSGPQIVRYGSETAKRQILPQVAAGCCCLCIGMSEPDAGSDLAAVRTRGTRVEGGWRVTGSKLWTSHAHRADYMIALIRTGEPVPQKHAGLTQVIVDMRGPGLRTSPIEDMTGGRDFNEVSLDEVFVSDEFVLGSPGEGWKLVTGELAYERSGPERFMSTFTLLDALVERIGPAPDERSGIALGRLVAHFVSLRRMSNAVAGVLEQGRSPDVEAALVKDLGTAFEREVVEVARQTVSDAPESGSADRYRRILAESMLAAPSFTLRGGTREILRGIVAKQLTRA